MLWITKVPVSLTLLVLLLIYFVGTGQLPY
jgi:hypothetical protein